MDRRAGAFVVGAVVACAGVAVIAVAWAVGAAGWLVADVPGAENDALRALSLALAGTAFVVVAVVGTGLALNPAASVPEGRVSAGRSVGAGLVGVASLLVAVAGAGRWAATSMADSLRPVLDRAEDLNAPSGDGRVLVLVGLLLAAVAFATLVAPARAAH